MLRTKRCSSVSARARLQVEVLEDRCLLSANLNVLQTNLVSDLPGVAQHLDPNLVNPWGISESAGSPFWVADNNSSVSTLYNTAGVPQSLVVSMPSPGDPLGSTGTPTGTVFNIDGGAAGGFKVTGFTKTGAPTSAAAIFLFATEDGTIIGWNPGVNPKGFDPAKAGTYGIVAVDNSAVPSAASGAVYKGLTIATDSAGNTHLYAANFRAGVVEIYNPDFTVAGTFTDPQLTAQGYAPFNVQVLGGKLDVTFAKQNADKHDDVAGQGRGFVDVFNLDGTPGLAKGNSRLISRGQLDAPWGLAIAPAKFGNLAGSLLVGNFGNGKINAYNATTGAFLGALKDPDGEPIQIDGLWALKVGNGGNGGDAGTVYFTAGLAGETHGLFGSLQSVAPATPEGPAEAQAALAALDVAQIDLTVVVKDITTHATFAQFQQDFQTFLVSLGTLARAEHQLDLDIRHDHDGPGSATVVADEQIDQFFAELFRL
jgi:uncharacterized protein (TIGR03118 family)